jgi:hypothetical protein
VAATPEHAAGQEEVVVLAPGARKRVRFHLLLGNGVTVSLTEAGRLVAREQIAARRLALDSVLVVDGEPETLVVSDVATGGFSVPVSTDDLTDEASCYVRFQAVVLRNVDVTRLEPEVRAALDDLVLLGGTVVVSATDERLGRRAFFDEAAGPIDASGPFARKRVGLGSILLVPEDVGAASASGQVVRALLGGIVLRAPAAIYPRVGANRDVNEAALLAAGYGFVFLVCYVLVIGPVFALVNRRRSPARVARGVVVALLGMLFCSVVLATHLRGQASRIRVTSFVLSLPGQKDSVVFSDVTVHSGGRRDYDLELSGAPLALTSYRSGGFVAAYQGVAAPLTGMNRTLRSAGKRALGFKDAVAPFGAASLAVLARVPARPPIAARVEPGRGAVTIANDGTDALGAGWVRSLGATQGGAPFEPLEPGARTLARFDPDAGIPVAWKTLRTFAVAGWNDLIPPGRDGLPARYVLTVEDRPPFQVTSTTAVVDHRAWRIEAVEAAPAPVPGWLGLEVATSFRGATIVRVLPDSPASPHTWMFRKGRTITTVAGAPVSSQEDLDRVLAHVGAGERVLVVLSDGGAQWLTTAPPPGFDARKGGKK